SGVIELPNDKEVHKKAMCWALITTAIIGGIALLI
ncbi:unnamed protein product, partial [marine sediment metagenome]